MKALLVGLLACTLVTGCHQSNAIPSTTGDLYTAEQVAGTSDMIVYRFIDAEIGAVCYVLEGHRAGGIYCVDRKPPIE